MLKPKKIKLFLFGQIDSSHYHYCKESFQAIKKRFPNLIELQINEFVETDFRLFFSKFIKTFQNKSILSHNKKFPVIIINNTEYCQNFEQFLIYFEDQFNYTVNIRSKNNDISLKETSQIEAEKALSNYLKPTQKRKYCFFKIKISNSAFSKEKLIIFELFNDILPKTVNNFFNLCKGIIKKQDNTPKKQHYLGTKLRSYVSKGIIQGGDIDKEGGECIYNEKYFEDESFFVKHDIPGIIGMCHHKGYNHTNGSMFYITLQKLDYFDKKFVAFGRIIKGMNAIKIIDKLDNSFEDATVIECGVYE